MPSNIAKQAAAVARARARTQEQMPSHGALCDATDTKLNFGDDWYHKKGSGVDLCASAVAQLSQKERALFIKVTCAEDLGEEAPRYALVYPRSARETSSTKPTSMKTTSKKGSSFPAKGGSSQEKPVAMADLIGQLMQGGPEIAEKVEQAVAAVLAEAPPTVKNLVEKAASGNNPDLSDVMAAVTDENVAGVFNTMFKTLFDPAASPATGSGPTDAAPSSNAAANPTSVQTETSLTTDDGASGSSSTRTEPLRSLDSNTPKRVNFTNTNDFPVEAFWLDFSGQEVKYAMIDPGNRWSVNTYATHPWRFRRADDNTVVFEWTAARNAVSPAAISIPATKSSEQAEDEDEDEENTIVNINADEEDDESGSEPQDASLDKSGEGETSDRSSTGSFSSDFAVVAQKQAVVVTGPSIAPDTVVVVGQTLLPVWEVKNTASSGVWVDVRIQPVEHNPFGMRMDDGFEVPSLAAGESGIVSLSLTVPSDLEPLGNGARMVEAAFELVDADGLAFGEPLRLSVAVARAEQIQPEDTVAEEESRLLEALEQMGFGKSEEVRGVLRDAGGDMEQAVMALLQNRHDQGQQ